MIYLWLSRVLYEKQSFVLNENSFAQFFSKYIYEDRSIETCLICATITTSPWQRNSIARIVCLSSRDSDRSAKNIRNFLFSKRYD